MLCYIIGEIKVISMAKYVIQIKWNTFAIRTDRENYVLSYLNVKGTEIKLYWKKKSFDGITEEANSIIAPNHSIWYRENNNYYLK